MTTKQFIIAGILIANVLWCSAQGLSQYVDPMVGTGAHGHTFPGAIVPHGMVQPGPDTRQGGWDGCSGYHYSDDTLYGFSHTHLSGTGCEDYGDLLVMPFGEDADMGQGKIEHRRYQSHFSHNHEEAHPGYYRVLTDRWGIVAEMSCSQRAAYHRYTFLHKGRKGLVIDLHHRDKLLSGHITTALRNGKRLIIGHRESAAWNPDQKLFFALYVPYSRIEYRSDSTQAIVYIDEKAEEVEMVVALSAVDEEGAISNLMGERDQRGRFPTFGQSKKMAQEQWEEALSKIVVEGGSQEQRRTFYTALYHCMTAPYLFSDIDGRYRGTDDKIHTVPPGKEIYTVFSLWDTYRTLHPLLTLIDRRRSGDFIYTFLQQYRQGGELPQWELAAHETHCMIGYHAAPVILEGLGAGLIADSLKSEILAAMVATSNRTAAHRSYARQGYLGSEEDNESVSKTLEYAYDDWCIATYAHAIGDSVTEREYLRRSLSYRNIIDADGLAHARRNGAWTSPFDPTEVNNHYTEGNSWQYSSYVPHDIAGWIAMEGGREAAEKMLDQLFESTQGLTGRSQADLTGLIGQYAHGNEPSHHTAYLYTYLGRGDKTQAMVRRICNELYTTEPHGLCGNEDCGQMSAWYVMSALGFYPVCPGSGLHVVGSPLFDRATIALENGEKVVIDCPHQRAENAYVQTLTVDGERRDALEISCRELERGCHIVMEMGSQGRRAGCTMTAQTTPYTVAPTFDRWEQRFDGATTVRIDGRQQRDSVAEVYYTLDGSRPTTLSAQYTGPIAIPDTAKQITIQAVAYTAAGGYSAVVKHTMTRYAADKTLKYITEPDPQYYENGAEGLIDGLYGTTNFRIGGWQGWTGDMKVVIDLGKLREVHRVGVDCLEDTRPWIFPPQRIVVEYSTDGEHYQPWGSVTNSITTLDDTRADSQRQYTLTATGQESARYLRITAVNYGKMPTWHTSAGEQSWLFIDEIVVE